MHGKICAEIPQIPSGWSFNLANHRFHYSACNLIFYILFDSSDEFMVIPAIVSFSMETIPAAYLIGPTGLVKHGLVMTDYKFSIFT